MNRRLRKRCLLIALALLASSIIPVLAAAEEEPAPAAVAKAPCSATPPTTTRLDGQANAGLLATGGATLWFTYGTSLVTAAAFGLGSTPSDSFHALARSPSAARVSSGANGWLALPVAGPFITAATMPKLDPKGPLDHRAFRSIMIADGALQAAGVGMIVHAELTAKPAFTKVMRARTPGGPCEAEYAPAAKRGAGMAPGDQRLIPVGVGAFMLVLFHPLSEVIAVSQSHDHARLWALVPGPGPIIAAATLDPKKVPDSHGSNIRVAYALLGGVEMASIGLMASAPLWKHPPTTLPDVKVGAGSASLTWKF